MYIVLHVRYPLFSSAYNEIWIFAIYILKNNQISNFTKILSLGAESLNAKRQTDRHDEGNSRSSQFCWFLGCVAMCASRCVPNFREKRCLHFECKRTSITDWRSLFLRSQQLLSQQPNCISTVLARARHSDRLIQSNTTHPVSRGFVLKSMVLYNNLF